MNKPKYTILKSLSLVSFFFSSFLLSGQWTELHTGFGVEGVKRIDCTDANNCFAGGTSNGKILKTTDGGQNWLDVGPVSNSGIFGFQMFHPDTLFASVGVNLYKTFDGGLTWTQPNLSAIDHWDFISTNIGYNVFYPNAVAKTIDGAVNWTLNTLTSPDAIYIYKLHFWDEMTGFAIGTSDVSPSIYKTLDGAVNWTTVFENNAAMMDIQMITPQIGFACGTNGIIVKTTDGGNNWQELVNPAQGSRDLLALDFISPQSGYVVGDSIILKTTDGGSSWTFESATSVLKDVKIADLQTVFIAPEDGDKILKNSQANLISQVSENEIFSGKIYPNPSSGYLSIELQKSGCSIQILEQNGKLILESKLKDNTVTSLDLSFVKPGLYIYRITDSDQRTVFGKFTKI